MEWYSAEKLQQAWRYAKMDVRDDFVFDVIDHADVKHNVDRAVSSLSAQLRDDLYYSAPLLRIGVPKNDHSVRPGTKIELVDLIVLYAIVQQLAPLLDPSLCQSAYAYRLNPRAGRSGQPLFADATDPGAPEEDAEDGGTADEAEVVVDFPYNWFVNWKPFHEAGKLAAEHYEHVAVTDIVAYFENISLGLLRETIKEQLGSQASDLVDRLFRLLEFWVSSDN